MVLVFKDAVGKSVLKTYNYIEQSWGEDSELCKENIEWSFHPAKEIACAIQGNTILQYTDFHLKKAPRKIELNESINACRMSTGRFFATINWRTNTIFIIDLLNNDNDFFGIKCNEILLEALFYPADFILVTLSYISKKEKMPKIMRYWNIKTRKLIDYVIFSGIKKIYDYSFFPDGKEMVAICDDTCGIYAVPFKVRYELIKEKLSLCLCALRSAIEQQKQGVQQDLFRLLCNFLYNV